VGGNSSGATIIKTNNGGATWSPISAGMASYLSSVNFFDTNHGYVVGSSTVYGIILKWGE
jgi:photosystem II stability/assembly factor-like uncharacterized protein